MEGLISTSPVELEVSKVAFTGEVKVTFKISARVILRGHLHSQKKKERKSPDINATVCKVSHNFGNGIS